MGTSWTAQRGKSRNFGFARYRLPQIIWSFFYRARYHARVTAVGGHSVRELFEALDSRAMPRLSTPSSLNSLYERVWTLKRLFPRGSDPTDNATIAAFTTQQWHSRWKSTAQQHAAHYHKLRPDVPTTPQRAKDDRRRRSAVPRAVIGAYHGLRMSSSKLKAHLHKKNLCDYPTCSCRTADETTRHFLLRCPLYDTQRLAAAGCRSTLPELLLADRSCAARATPRTPGSRP